MYREWQRRVMRCWERNHMTLSSPASLILIPPPTYTYTLFLYTFRCYLVNKLRFKQPSDHDCGLFHFLMCFLNCGTRINCNQSLRRRNWGRCRLCGLSASLLWSQAHNNKLLQLKEDWSILPKNFLMFKIIFHPAVRKVELICSKMYQRKRQVWSEH